MKDKASLLDDALYYSYTSKHLIKQLLDVSTPVRLNSSKILDIYSHWFIMHSAVVETEVSQD